MAVSVASSSRPLRAALACAALSACGGAPSSDAGRSEAAPTANAPAVEPGPGVVRLSRLTERVVLELPETNLTPGRQPGVVPLRGEFVRHPSSTAETTAWRIALPFAWPPRGTGPGVGAADDGLTLSDVGGRLPRSDAPRPGTWSVVDGELEVRVRAGAPAPRARDHKLGSEALAAVEGALSGGGQAADPIAWSFHRVTDEGGAYDAVYLPAPGSVTWTLDVPPAAVFDAGVHLLPAPVSGGSDGATAILEADVGGGFVELARVDASREGARLRAPLAAVAGANTRLRVRSDPGVTRYHDYVALAAPVVYEPRAVPRRVILVQLDAVRRDELAPWGTGLEDLAAEVVAFDDAWTVAPWTLPATRGVLLGDQPERWQGRTTLPERLAAAGFATLALFDDPEVGPAVDRGWAVRLDVSGQGAARAAELAGSLLRDHADRDTLLLVQLGDVERAGVEAGEPWETDAPTASRARALQAVRAATRALVEAAGPEAIVAVYADHGSELDGAHADRLSDAVVHVPLWVRAPRIGPRRVAATASLTDLTPTILDLLGLPASGGVAGRSLAPVLREEAEARPRLVAFGRALGTAAWGLAGGGVRWPGDPAPDDPGAALADALGVDVQRVWEVAFGCGGEGDLTLTASHPAGLSRAWRVVGPGVVEAVPTAAGALTWSPPPGACDVVLVPGSDTAALGELVVELRDDGAPLAGAEVSTIEAWAPSPDAWAASGPRADGVP